MVKNNKKSKYFPDLIEISHSFIQGLTQEKNLIAQTWHALDGTAGNGYDTLFLTKLAGIQGHVFAYDVQERAIQATREVLIRAGLEQRVTLFTHGHEHIQKDLAAFFGTEQPKPRLHAAMFNFGFLPGSDKTCITCPQTSLAALTGLMPWMLPGGGVSLHLYTGHPGGMEEALAIVEWATALSWKEFRVMRHEFANKAKNREILLLIEVLQNQESV